jgi:hypothetical protein
MADYTNSNKSMGSVFPDHAVDAQEWTRVEPLITPEQLKRRHLFGIPLYAFLPDPVTGKRDTLTPEDLMDQINRAVANIELQTGLTIFPVQYDEKQPFDRNWWESYGYIQTQKRPIASVEKVAFTPATQSDILVLDPTWIESANFTKGQINIIPLVPAASTGLVQATIGSGGAAFITIFYGKHWIPALVRVTYTCGFPNRELPRVVNEVVGMEAAINILRLLAATNRANSYSLGTDGLSQSQSGPGPLIYKDLIEGLEAKKLMMIEKLKNIYGLKVHTSYV